MLLIDGYGELLKVLKAFEKRVRSFFDAKTVVIFGASSGGKKVLSLCKELGREVAFFVDNDPQKWDKFLNGVRIISPDKIPSAAPEIIIVASKWKEEIFMQLRKMEYNGEIFTDTFVELISWGKKLLGDIFRGLIDELDDIGHKADLS